MAERLRIREKHEEGIFAAEVRRRNCFGVFRCAEIWGFVGMEVGNIFFRKVNIFLKKGLTKQRKKYIIAEYEKSNAALAQLDRVFGYEPKGRGFESPMPRQKGLRKQTFLFCRKKVRESKRTRQGWEAGEGKGKFVRVPSHPQ